MEINAGYGCEVTSMKGMLAELPRLREVRS